jgi:NAD(P)-dependent dehydrogenase (short-subunit alcohol dehydrogenase family)
MTRNVLITGASGGVGRAAVRRLDELGWQVFAGVRSRAAGEELAHGARAVVPIDIDVTDEQAVASARADVAERVGETGLHGLVNNAGLIVQGPIELVPLHALRRQFEVNVIGQVAVTQAVLPLLRAAEGRIVNIGAASGLVTVPMFGPISASKTALESLTDALRMELKHQGVRVSIVEPGAMATEIFAKAIAASERDGFAGGDAARRVYAKALAKSTTALADAKPAPVDKAVAAIVKALTDRRPRSRYLVGRDASQIAMLRHVPERVRDRLLMANVGLTAGAF